MTKKKGTTQNPADVFGRASRHKEFSANMQTGHSLPETDERFEKLLDLLEEAEKNQSRS